MKIEGYFDSFRKANDVVNALKSKGFKKAYVDINDHYEEDRNIVTNLPGTEAAPSLSALVLASGNPVVDRSKGPLEAASPMVSGMGGFEEIADVNCRVVVETDENSSEEVKKIITDMGGSLYNPNIKVPKTNDGQFVPTYDDLNNDLSNLY